MASSQVKLNLSKESQVTEGQVDSTIPSAGSYRGVVETMASEVLPQAAAPDTSATTRHKRSFTDLCQTANVSSVPRGIGSLIKEEASEIKEECRHVACGNRATGMPNVLSLPIIVAEYIVHPFQVLKSSTTNFIKRHSSSLTEEDEVAAPHKGHYHTTDSFGDQDTFEEYQVSSSMTSEN